MKYICSSDNIVVTNLDNLEFDDLSINIPKVYSFYVPSACTVTADTECIITGTDEDSNILTAGTVNVSAGGTLSMLFESTEVTTHTVNTTLTFSDNETLSFTITQEYVDITDRLVVLLNNFGIQITDEWIKCFYESNFHENEIDTVLKDRKSSEFLLELMDLIGLRGTYKTLNAAVAFFGYSDTVWFEEQWQNRHADKKRYTTVQSGFTSRRTANEGYSKIGDMSMFYSLDMLDPDEPYEEGGYPNYINREISFDDLYYKLLLLRKILNTTFIPWDTFIVDILGEMHAVNVQQKKFWVCNDTFINQDEEQRYDYISISYPDSETLVLSEEQMIVDHDLWTVDADESLILNSSTSAHLNAEFIRIEKLGVDSMGVLLDFDILTKYQRKDVAIIQPTIVLNYDQPDWVNGYVIQIFKLTEDQYENTYELLYKSSLLSYEDLTKHTCYGITKIGSYKFEIGIHDGWGYRKQFTYTFSVNVYNIITDFQLLRPKYVDNSTDAISRYQHFTSTHETSDTSAIPVIDSVFVNNQNPALWSLGETVETQYINRYYTTNINNFDLLQPISRYALVKVSSLCHTPIDEYYAPYDLLLLDILRPGTIISFKTFVHQEYVTVTYENDLQFIHDLINRSTDTDSPYSYFDFDIQKVNSNLTQRLQDYENDTATSVLMIYSRKKSFSIDKIIFRIECDEELITNDPLQQGYLTLQSLPITWFDKQLTLYVTSTTASEMIVDMNTNIPMYYNYIYPTFGSDAMIRLHTLYNETESELYKLTLNNKVLTLYGKPIAKNVNKEFVDVGSTGLITFNNKYLSWYGKNLTLNSAYDDNGYMNIDYHLRIRVGNIWFISTQEFGRLEWVEDPDTGDYVQRFMSDPLTFDLLKTYIDKNDTSFTNELDIPDEILDNIMIYYYDDNFVIRSTNGYDIEICQTNIGHAISSNRIGSISQMYKTVAGDSFEIGSTVIAIPDTDIKINFMDVSWTITNYLTNTVVFESSGYALKWISFTAGLFNLSMTLTDKLSGNVITKEKIGCMLFE